MLHISFVIIVIQDIAHWGGVGRTVHTDFFKKEKTIRGTIRKISKTGLFLPMFQEKGKSGITVTLYDSLLAAPLLRQSYSALITAASSL